MRAVVQRCGYCEVDSDWEKSGHVGYGLLVFLVVRNGDTEKDGDYLADKIINLRIFEDEQGKMNRSILDEGGELMIVSQFTLYGDCRHGRRPSFFEAELPEKANRLYEYVVQKCRAAGLHVETGRFQTMMHVRLDNVGPITILLDSQKEF